MPTTVPSPPAPGALAGLKVLEMGALIAGPFCAKLLGEFGADVVKIEPPGRGDEARNVPPFAEADDSIYFQSLNRGARGLTLDLRSDADPYSSGMLCCYRVKHRSCGGSNMNFY